MFGLSKIPTLIIVVMSTLGVASVASYAAYKTHASALQKIEELSLRLQTCNARLMDIAEDKQSDATVTDPSLFDVPDHWMRGNIPYPR